MNQAQSLNLSGRVAVVTGAAQGIGRAEAIALASHGASVVLADIQSAENTVAEIRRLGGTASFLQADISQRGAAETAMECALETYGSLDIIVNNAGLVRDRMSFNLDDDDWDLVLGVNLTGSFMLARAAARYWRTQDVSPMRRIINTTSESGIYGNAGQANYAAAKSGVLGLTLTLASELYRYGVRVSAIAPRARTPMSISAFGEREPQEDFDRFAPEHVASLVCWLVSDLAVDVTGQVFTVDGSCIELLRGWTRAAACASADGWDDTKLQGLGEVLFTEVIATNLVPPVAERFDL